MLMLGCIPVTYLRWWDGVVCGKEGNESVATRVAMLILPKKGLKGTISRSLGRLDKLKLLDLSCNRFKGVLPTRSQI
ncbi:hypothetical protein Q3G72_007994 [Acer saccharum]|nr:hypothetical protein Q3G72_020285 [Acer saccharum]KAK1581678.1 hypothetical protein Q3G72_007994 [Acer saccharum]